MTPGWLLGHLHREYARGEISHKVIYQQATEQQNTEQQATEQETCSAVHDILLQINWGTASGIPTKRNAGILIVKAPPVFWRPQKSDARTKVLGCKGSTWTLAVLPPLPHSVGGA